MSSTRSVMVSDHEPFDVIRDGDIGGLSAFIYFLTVSLCMPSSRAIPRMDRPLRFALCTAFHLAVCNGVGFLCRRIAALRTLPAQLRPEVAMGFSASQVASRAASLAVHLLPSPLLGGWSVGVCTVLPAKPRRTLGRGGAS